MQIIDRAYKLLTHKRPTELINTILRVNILLVHALIIVLIRQTKSNLEQTPGQNELQNYLKNWLDEWSNRKSRGVL